MNTDVIYVPNGCTNLVDNATGQKWVDAIQRKLVNDVGPAWNWAPVLHYVGDSHMPKPADATGIVRLVSASGNAGTLGSHWLDGTTPTGEVGVKTCLDDGVAPSSCLDHELTEMFDKYASMCFQLRNLILAAELCDRVEDSDPDYKVDGVLCENFSLPSAFLDGNGPWDFRGKCTSNVVLPGGYQLWFNLKTMQWEQVTGERARKSKRGAGLNSRRRQRIEDAGHDPAKLVVVAA